MRFGDPECQCLMARLQSDLLETLMAAADGALGSMQLQWSPETALTVRVLSFLERLVSVRGMTSCKHML